MTWLYLLASFAAAGVTLFLVLVGGEFTLRQWMIWGPMIPVGVFAGWAANRLLPQRHFDVIVYLLLGITSLHLIVSSFWSLARQTVTSGSSWPLGPCHATRYSESQPASLPASSLPAIA